MALGPGKYCKGGCGRAVTVIRVGLRGIYKSRVYTSHHYVDGYCKNCFLKMFLVEAVRNVHKLKTMIRQTEVLRDELDRRVGALDRRKREGGQKK